MSTRRAGRVHLYRLPAARLLTKLPLGSIDVLITDPPYTTVERSGHGYLKDWFRGGLDLAPDRAGAGDRSAEDGAHRGRLRDE